MEHFRAAACIDPRSALPLVNIGNIYQELGDLKGAEAVYRNALLLQPDSGLAYARLATLVRANLPEVDRAELEIRLSDPTVPTQLRARLLFALAHVLDARGDYSRASELLREANALTLENAIGYRAYEADRHSEFAKKIIRRFTSSRFRKLGGGNLSRSPIFVFGMPRSGTTLTEQILSSHKDVFGAGELRLVRRTFEAMPGAIGLTRRPIDCVPRLTDSTIEILSSRHLEQLNSLNDEGREMIVDKMPDNYMYLPLIMKMFPNAKLFYCIRDPRDVATSCWMTDFRSIRWANDFKDIATRINTHREIMRHWRSEYGAEIMEVHYEETVENVECAARRIIEACGLPWDPACLEFYRTARRVRTASVTQVRQPIYRKSVARWRNYQEELAEMFGLLDDVDGVIAELV